MEAQEAEIRVSVVGARVASSMASAMRLQTVVSDLELLLVAAWVKQRPRPLGAPGPGRTSASLARACSALHAAAARLHAPVLTLSAGALAMYSRYAFAPRRTVSRKPILHAARVAKVASLKPPHSPPRAANPVSAR